MHAEYAVEPAAVGNSWANCRYILEMFGFDKGRLISQFPKSWLREAYDAADALPDIEKKIAEKLNSAKRDKFIRTGRPYVAADPWLENAIAQHAVSPFQAILALDNPQALAYVLKCDELDNEHPLLLATHTRAIAREAATLAGAMRVMLGSASSIAFVDPYYSPFSREHQSTLGACLHIVAQTNAQALCEIHHKDHGKAPPVETIEREAALLYRGIIPAGLVIKIYRWREKDGGADFHARYLLTDRGGLNVEAGFSAEGAHQTTDITLLPAKLSQEKSAAYQRSSTIYELVEPVIQIASDGSVSRI